MPAPRGWLGHEFPTGKTLPRSTLTVQRTVALAYLQIRGLANATKGAFDAPWAQPDWRRESAHNSSGRDTVPRAQARGVRSMGLADTTPPSRAGHSSVPVA